MIACSRMYNAAAACRDAWAAIFERVSERSGVPLAVIDHPAPAPLEELWARDDMGCVFMCGWPFAMADPQPRLIAAPVPSPPRYGGEPVYFTDLVVRADSRFETLEDTFGGRLAWTVETSHSGFNAPRYHLLRFRTPERQVLYGATLGPLVSPVRALQSVVEGTADVAPLDSLFHDLLRLHAPERAAAIRVIDTTEAAPIPPLVASAGADPDACAGLTDALLEIHGDPSLRTALDTVMVERFVTVEPENYGETVARAHEAIDAGYPAPE